MSDQLKRATHPFKTLVETITGRGTRGLDIPGTLTQRVETKLVGDFGGVHGVGQILRVQSQSPGKTYLLIGKHQQQCIPKFVLAQHALHWEISHDLFCMSINSHSSRASTIRSLSFESTTKMIPWVFWKSFRQHLFHVVWGLTHSASRGDGSCPVLPRPTP